MKRQVVVSVLTCCALALTAAGQASAKGHKETHHHPGKGDHRSIEHPHGGIGTPPLGRAHPKAGPSLPSPPPLPTPPGNPAAPGPRVSPGLPNLPVPAV